MATQLLERYLKNVAKGLPETQNEDIVRELREDIQSEMEDRERELGRALTEDEQMAMLRQRGNPWVLAARYRQDGRSVAFGKELIGPVLFPFYLKVLSFNLGLTSVVVGVIFAALALSGHGVRAGDMFSTFLLQLFIQLSVVTLIFTLIERHLAEHPDRWNLGGTCGTLRLDTKVAENMPVPFEGKRKIARLESVSIIIASAVALVWMTGVRTYPFLILGPAASFLKLAPVWYQAYFPIVLLTVAEIVRAVINLVEPDWVLFRHVYGLFVGAAGPESGDLRRVDRDGSNFGNDVGGPVGQAGSQDKRPTRSRERSAVKREVGQCRSQVRNTGTKQKGAFLRKDGPFPRMTESLLRLTLADTLDAGAGAASCNRVIDDQDDDGTNDGYKDAVEVDASHANVTEGVEQPAAEDGAKDPKNDVHDDALAGLVDDFAGDETRDQPKNNPSEK